MTTTNAGVCPTRVYRKRSAQRTVGLIFVAAGLLLWVAIWGQVIRGTREGRVLDLLFPVVFTALCLLFTYRAHQADVRTTDGSIVMHTILRRHILPFHAIQGRRTYVDRGDGDYPDVWHFVLESSDERYPSLDIEDVYDFDPTFRGWFYSLPDLDEEERWHGRLTTLGRV
ncbi:hypothetical protein DYQ86_24460 [Acidobacteria bacterium AB60]|nr:hypothetical protein DYQ86_24460 [Acidobacteria bacterium AB60]